MFESKIYCDTIQSMKKFILLTIILILFLTGCGNTDIVTSSEKVSNTGFYFDTVITITLYGTSDETIIESCFELCSYYENLFSRTITESEISTINASNDFVSVSDDTIQLLMESVKYSEITQGKFDITVQKLSSLWDITSDTPKVPSQSDLDIALSTVGYENIIIEGNSVKLSNPDTGIDLGGIAKGFIADRLKEYLINQGINSALINLGGNILMIGSKPDGSDFNIGIQKPFGEQNEIMLYVKGSDLSIVTSGIYERYFYENDIFYHHILDTDTGYPVENELLSVTIISYISTEGDALSTGCFALGPQKGMELIESLEGVEAIFVDKNNNLTYSSGLYVNDNTITLK